MTKDELKELTALLFEDLKDLKIRLGRIGKFNPEAVQETYNIIIEVIKKVETYSVEVKTLTGEDKKKLAVEIINEVVDIPWMPEYIEAAIFGWSIDLLIDVFNKLGGKAWIDSLFQKDE